MRERREAELLEVLPVEAQDRARAPRRSRRDRSAVARAALAGLVMGLGILLAIAGAEGGGASPTGARVPTPVGDVVRPSKARTFVALDVSLLSGIRTASLPWRFGRAAFTFHCEGGARVLDADVWALASSVTYRWVIAEPGNTELFQSMASTPSVRVRILIGTGSAERLVPEQSRDYLRLVTRMVFTAPLDGLFARPLLVVNGQTEAPGLGWVVAAPDDVVTLLRQSCARSNRH